MSEYTLYPADIVELDSKTARKVLERLELVQKVSLIYGIPPELLEKGDEIARNITKYVDSDGIAQNVALEVDGDGGNENAGKTQR